MLLHWLDNTVHDSLGSGATLTCCTTLDRDLELELHNRAVELDQRDEIIRRLMAERDPYTAAAAMKLPTQDEQPYIMPASAGERPLVLLPPFNPHAGYTGWR